MKKIINGKTYNTETAEEVGHYWNGLGTGDFRNISEKLYQTTKGAWFLAGEGGPMTKYARPCGNMTGGGSNIFPLTKAEALEWLESYGETDAIEKHFADIIEEA